MSSDTEAVEFSASTLTLVADKPSFERFLDEISIDLAAHGSTVFIDYDFVKFTTSEEKFRALAIGTLSGSTFCIDLHSMDRMFGKDEPLRLLLGDDVITKVTFQPESMLNCLMDKFNVITDAVLDLAVWSWFKKDDLEDLARKFAPEDVADRLQVLKLQCLTAFDNRSIPEIRNLLPIYQSVKIEVLKCLYRITSDCFRIGAVRCFEQSEPGKKRRGFLSSSLLSDRRDGHVVPSGVFGSKVRVVEIPIPETFECELCRKRKSGPLDAKRIMWFKGWHRCRPCCTFKWQQVTRLIGTFESPSGSFWEKVVEKRLPKMDEAQFQGDAKLDNRVEPEQLELGKGNLENLGGDSEKVEVSGDSENPEIAAENAENMGQSLEKRDGERETPQNPLQTSETLRENIESVQVKPENEKYDEHQIHENGLEDTESARQKLEVGPKNPEAPTKPKQKPEVYVLPVEMEKVLSFCRSKKGKNVVKVEN